MISVDNGKRLDIAVNEVFCCASCFITIGLHAIPYSLDEEKNGYAASYPFLYALLYSEGLDTT